jgi:hypothetical protein
MAGPVDVERDGSARRELHDDRRMCLRIGVGHDHRAAHDDVLGRGDVLEVGEHVAVVVHLVVVGPEIGSHGDHRR